MKVLSVFTLALGSLFSLGAHGAVVGEWDASDYSGGAIWPGTADATVREGTPTAGNDNTSFPGFDIDFVSFGPPDAAFEVSAAGNGVAGLAEFSASVVFRTSSNGSSGENDFWRNEGMVGIELPGGGVGDWGVGIAAGGLINGGSALGSGDTGSLGPVVNDNTWHVATMVIDDQGNGTHDRRLYLDGAEVASDVAIAYGGGSSVAANSAIFFGDNQPGDPNATKENYEGDIAHIRLDNVALTPAEISALHSDYLGTRVSTTDSDGDTLPDLWETSWPGISDLSDLNDSPAGSGPGSGTGDFDGDGLSDTGEFAEGTDPTNPDTDGDGVSDGDEVANGTNPTEEDTDGDGLLDGVETGTGTFNGPTDTGTDPLNPDTDGDGLLNDGQEVADGTDPNDGGDPTFLQVYTFNADDEGFTELATGNSPIPSTYNSARGTWEMTGDDSGPATNTITSPEITLPADGGLQILFNHRYSIETEWDGTALQVSLNGGPFETVPNSDFIQNGYTWTGLIGNHVLNGGDGFNGDSPGYSSGQFITSIANYRGGAAGDTVQLQFLGAWDEGARGPGIPNWEIDAVALRLRTDTDGDGIPDSYEEDLFPGDLGQLGTGDFDSDEVNDPREFYDGTDPTVGDTDMDGSDDGEEKARGTNPLNPDTDGDGLQDGVETGTGTFVSASDTGTDPLNPDTDGDGFYNDGLEVANNTDPNDPNDPRLSENTGALLLDGDGDWVSFENVDGSIPTGAEPFTLEAWINPISIPTGGGNGGQITFWGNQTGNQSNGFRLRGATGTRHYFWGNDHDENFGIDILPDTTGLNGWHHLAFTYDGNQTIWYWNGAPLGNPRIVSGVNVADVNFRIGSRLNAEFFHGWIDELRIWNLPRTPEEIAENFSFALPPDTQGLVAYWDFSKGLTDITGNGHDGTAQGDASVDPLASAPVIALVQPKVPFRVDQSGGEIVLTWSSKGGKLYNVRSETGLDTPPLDWPTYAGLENIAADPPENTLRFDLPADNERFFVVEEFDAPPVKIFNDDFEGGQGSWTTGSDGAGAGTAWAIGTPSNVGPAAANSGTFCFGTNIAANYTDESSIWLRSPAIDLTTAGGATLLFWQFRDIEASFDAGSVRILDAADDSLIEEILAGIDGTGTDWEEITKALPAAALGKTIKVEFRFTSDNFNTNPQAGWYIDDVMVTVP